MIVFPHCKINLGLRITGSRNDGYHNLDTVFYPVPLCDVLEIIATPSAERPLLSLYGIPVAGPPDQNLCTRAWDLLKQDFPDLPAVHIHLFKNIPSGAGLGGGSADGSFMLRLLNARFRLHIAPARLSAYALQLGSDCPFFLNDQPCHGTGRGDILTPVPVALAGYTLVLLNPNIHISTAEAFRQYSTGGSGSPQHSTATAVTAPIQSWKDTLANDFEPGIFSAYPVIGHLKDSLYKAGALYAALSGSGSTVFGIFARQDASRLSFPQDATVINL